MASKLVYILLMVSIIASASSCSVSSVKAAASLVILPTDSGYLNANGFYYVVGEVENTGNVTVTDVYVNATFHDSSNKTIAQISQTTKLLYILPNRISPFDTTVYNVTLSQEVNNYTLRVTQFSATQDRPESLEITSANSFSDSNGYHVSGTVKNAGIQSTAFTNAIATFYNANGHAVAVILNYTDPSFLEVNQTATFSTSLSGSVANQVHNYILEAESYDYESVPEFQPALLVLTLLMLATITFLEPKRFLSKARATPA